MHFMSLIGASDAHWWTVAVKSAVNGKFDLS